MVDVRTLFIIILFIIHSLKDNWNGKHLEGISSAFRLKRFHWCPSDSSTGAERFYRAAALFLLPTD